MKNYKSFHFAFAAAAAMGLSLTACGDDVTEVTEVHKDGMAVLESGEKLSKQACDTTNVGEMLFVMDSSEVFVCDGESWQTLKGEDGKDGEDGTNCTAKSVKNKEKTRSGIEVTCGEKVVGTIWNGKDGANGTAGKSAYEIAKDNGFEGTEAEWLESMESPFLQDKRDGKIYKTVKIGDQVWMAENLNYSVNPGEQSWCGGGESGTTNEGDCSVYGRLYTWAAAVGKSEDECGFENACDLPSGDIRGVCPEGWHLPDTTEWNTLIDFAGGMASAGKMLKASTGWEDNNGSSGNGMDAFGFSALPAGRKNDPTGSFVNVGAETAFMSAVQKDQSGTNNNGKNAFLVILGNAYEKAAVGAMAKTFATSVRCLKD